MNFIDLQAQYKRYKGEIDQQLAGVLESCQFIMGPDVAQLESELAAHTGVSHAIGCSSGTDALLLCLMAKDLKPGDEVLVPDFTFFATAEVVSFLGATPVFVDIQPDTYNIDPASLEKHMSAKTRGIMPVSLFGQCADMDELQGFARSHGLWVIEDAAQSYGALYKGRRSGSIAELSATSFFPAKPLGCYGDGGAVFTSDGDLAKRIRGLLNHGQSERYIHGSVGMNGRLDTLQAAVLRVKLRHFDEEMVMKRKAAEGYTERLHGKITTPSVRPYNQSVWAQYTPRSEHRERILSHLKAAGVPTAIHYPIPLHAQKAFAGMALRDVDYPVATRVSKEVFSIPMHPFLCEKEVDAISNAILEAIV